MARYVTGNIVLDEPWQRELHLPAPPVSEEVLGRTQSKSKEKAALSVGEKLRYLGYVLVLTVLFIGVLAVFAHYVQLHYETVQLEKQVRDISAMNEALRLEVAELKKPERILQIATEAGLGPQGKEVKTVRIQSTSRP
ncbi:MAG: hypothetical protein IMX04_01110 [Candidatus Carbobacillus altaicus]|uniref:Cell division protein FtsL n=1 Tax=Candidatus Carbonibacillus altaicus TaxID=2163959 RepID=A0A2R6Y360_9BACL|nr:hypothetical protein [Candidatus Carbobacillus altaicus]PTQ57111.1 MAG: hypothetical protein BSOLF_2262 [Candidatus Carbobacillus altaicus]